MPSSSPTLSRSLRKNNPSAASSRPANENPATLVPYSTEIPLYVRQHLEKAAGVGSRAAMGRKVLTDWSEANKASR